MENNETYKSEQLSEEKEVTSDKGSNNRIAIILLLVLILVIGTWKYLGKGNIVQKIGEKYFSGSRGKQVAVGSSDQERAAVSTLSKVVVPSEGIVLPATWKDYGKQLIDKGVIDGQKFEAIYAKRGGLSESDKKLLNGTDNDKIKITSENAGVLLNLLWAFGLGNKNYILEKGPMTDPQYGGSEKFASTGGWTIAKGSAMDHYSKYKFVTLTPDQQAKVERVSKGIFRPCCGNSTYFPDCNHGMAMLGLLEIMANQGVSEYDMYKAALQVNSYWFPDTYLTLASYFEKEKNTAWDLIDPKEVLGVNYSSSSGYRNILQSVDPVSLQQKDGSCGV